jgi:hypothetical protein
MKNSNNPQKNAGQKPILRCSQTLSLTALIIARGFHFLPSSKVKCKKTPDMEIKGIPDISIIRII